MSSMEREPEDPFVDAFVQYLDVLQEATCDLLLEREQKPGRLKSAGRKLVEASGPEGLKGAAEKLSVLVDVLEAQGQLVSRDFYEIKDLADTLRKFGPHLEKNYGLTLCAGVSSEGDGVGYLDTNIGKSVAVGKGELRSTIFVKNLIGQTGNRLRREKNDEGRCIGWVDDELSTYYDLDASAERAMSEWKIFRGLGSRSEDACEARLRKLAYEELFDRFRDDGAAFARELALYHVKNTAIHEFHHEKIVGKADACRQIREACAYLYSLSKTTGPEGTFGELHSIYRLRHDSDERYRRAANMALDYLGKAKYSEENWLSIGPDGRAEVSARIAGQAKAALKLLEKECSLRRHEDVEALLKPDFDGYDILVRDAVSARLAEGN